MLKLGPRVGLLLKQPWFWIVLLDLIWVFLLWPLLDSPQNLYPFLRRTGMTSGRSLRLSGCTVFWPSDGGF